MISRRAFLSLAAASGFAALGALTGCGSSVESSASASASASVSATASASAAASASASASASVAEEKVAVVCFSATNNTWGIAQQLAAADKADLVRIEAAEPYTEDDLNYNSDCRANAEQNSGTARPEIAGGAPDLSAYSTIYLGYPIWWGKAPRIIFTVLESQSFEGKKIVPFCTSGSSSIEGSLGELRVAAPDAIWGNGKRFDVNASAEEIAALL